MCKAQIVAHHFYEDELEGQDFYVRFYDGGDEFDNAGPYEDEHDAVMAARRSGFELVF